MVPARATSDVRLPCPVSAQQQVQPDQFPFDSGRKSLPAAAAIDQQVVQVV